MKIKLNILSITLVTLLSSFTSLSAMSFSVNRNYMGNNLIYASGQIRFGDAYKLERKYRSLDRSKQTIVVFNSNGGIMSEGIRIGKFLKANRIGSAVKKYGICASSCALAFLGGRDKSGSKYMILPYGSQLGYHSFYYNNRRYVKLNKVQRDISNVLDYATYVDAPNSLMAKMFDTKSKDMYWINSQDRYALGIKHSFRRTSVASRARVSNTSNYSSYSQTNYTTPLYYVREYIGKINSLLAANRGLEFNSAQYAMNSIDYNSWLTQNLRYMHLKTIKQINSYTVSARVVYALKNGQRVCSNNRYVLTKTYNNSWKILSKQHKACDRSSKKTLNRISRALP